jgi:hypothetical protein
MIIPKFGTRFFVNKLAGYILYKCGKSIGLDPSGGIILTPLIVKYIMRVKLAPRGWSRT